MHKQRLSTELQQRLREYFHQTAHLRSAQKQATPLTDTTRSEPCNPAGRFSWWLADRFS